MLKASRGAIVATASISATQPTPPHGAYSASKAALVMLIKQMAYEFGPDGIRCNCVSPGMIHTGMTNSVYSDPTLRAERASQIPLRRVGDPEDVAAVVAFLAGPAAGYVTGVDLIVDGGVSTALMPTMRRGAVPT
jgi:glucose 1-dehydrogenase